MSGFFDPNNEIMTFMGKLLDSIILSLVWIIFCIPIFTIGASTTALYYTTVKNIRRERGYLLKEFWKSFKSNFVGATILWIIILIIGVIYGVNFWFSWNVKGTIGFMLLMIYSMILFLILSVEVYTLPILSRFDMKTKDIVRTSAIIGIKHLPYSFLFILIIAVTLLALYVAPMLSIILPTWSCLLYSLLMERILKKYTQKTEEEGKDTWYLE